MVRTESTIKVITTIQLTDGYIFSLPGTEDVGRYVVVIKLYLVFSFTLSPSDKSTETPFVAEEFIPRV